MAIDETEKEVLGALRKLTEESGSECLFTALLIHQRTVGLTLRQIEIALSNLNGEVEWVPPLGYRLLI